MDDPTATICTDQPEQQHFATFLDLSTRMLGRAKRAPQRSNERLDGRIHPMLELVEQRCQLLGPGRVKHLGQVRLRLMVQVQVIFVVIHQPLRLHICIQLHPRPCRRALSQSFHTRANPHKRIKTLTSIAAADAPSLPGTCRSTGACIRALDFPALRSVPRCVRAPCPASALAAISALGSAPCSPRARRAVLAQRALSSPRTFSACFHSSAALGTTDTGGFARPWGRWAAWLAAA